MKKNFIDEGQVYRMQCFRVNFKIDGEKRVYKFSLVAGLQKRTAISQGIKKQLTTRFSCRSAKRHVNVESTSCSCFRQLQKSAQMSLICAKENEKSKHRYFMGTNYSY